MIPDYKVIATGRQNCVRIKDVMIDCGIPFKQLKEHLYDIRILLITHCHSDHMSIPTLKQIKKWFPHIKICGNQTVNAQFEMDIIIDEEIFNLYSHQIAPFRCIHNVETHGFVIDDILYITDTSSLENVPVKKYSMMMIECHHDKLTTDNFTEIFNTGKVAGKTVYHLDRQTAYQFYLENRMSEDTPFIELHGTTGGV